MRPPCDYDKSDTKIEGKWHEGGSIPQSIRLMIERHKQDQQLIEMEYDTLRKAGWINNNEIRICKCCGKEILLGKYCKMCTAERKARTGRKADLGMYSWYW